MGNCSFKLLLIAHELTRGGGGERKYTSHPYILHVRTFKTHACASLPIPNLSQIHNIARFDVCNLSVERGKKFKLREPSHAVIRTHGCPHPLRACGHVRFKCMCSHT